MNNNKRGRRWPWAWEDEEDEDFLCNYFDGYNKRYCRGVVESEEVQGRRGKEVVLNETTVRSGELRIAGREEQENGRFEKEE